MSITIPPATNTDDFSGNVIRPFQLETSAIRGRIVSFDNVMDDILVPHDYPKAVSELLAQVVTLCALLSSMLKFDGVFTLQTNSDGPVSMLVADMTSAGGVRGCANFDEGRLEALKEHDFKSLVGDGYIAFTVDQGENTERYQGIVELKGRSVTEAIEHYFTQSEQIKTNIKLAVEGRDKKHYGRGLILQQMPEDGGNKNEESKQDNQGHQDNVVSLKSEETLENWNRAVTLMDSCKEAELLDKNLNSHDILLRLFHEEGVRVFAPTPLQHQCRCSEGKVKNLYKMLSEEEREDIQIEGKVEMICDFCSKNYTYSLDELEV